MEQFQRILGIHLHRLSRTIILSQESSFASKELQVDEKEVCLHLKFREIKSQN